MPTAGAQSAVQLAEEQRKKKRKRKNKQSNLARSTLPNMGSTGSRARRSPAGAALENGSSGMGGAGWHVNAVEERSRTRVGGEVVRDLQGGTFER